MIKLTHRRVQKGVDEIVRATFQSEYRSLIGVVETTPVDLDGWKFKLVVHRHVEMCPETTLFEVEGTISTSFPGSVFFSVPACYNNIEPGMYWHTMVYTLPSGKVAKTLSAKYEIVPSLNEYFSIYK